MRSLHWLAVVLLVIVGVGIALNDMWIPRTPLAFATIAVGVITFFYFASARRGTASDSAGIDGGLREAIASAVVVEYLVMVGITAYFATSEQQEQLQPITNLTFPLCCFD